MDGFITIAEQKKALRKEVHNTLSNLTSHQLQTSDAALFSSFLALPQVQRANTLFLFWGIPGREPETSTLVSTLTKQGKRVGLPRMLPEHQMEVRLYEPEKPLVSVSFGIQEPPLDAPLLSKEEIDLVLVPAVCYDRQGYRLGFGGGYYDRWLSQFSGFTVGLCRNCILQDHVPLEPHDQSVQVLITDQETFFYE